MSPVRRLVAIGAGASLLLGLAGCVTEDAQGRPIRRQRPEQPDDVVVGRVAQGIYNLTAVDSNDNGVLDTILVLVWLFAADSSYANPIWVDGQLEFTLKDKEGTVLKTWAFTPEETASARAIVGEVGPGFTVPLAIGEALEERYSRRSVRVWLTCRFVPTEGEAVSVPEPDDVLIGSVGRPR